MQQDTWQPRQNGTVCFDDVEERRSDGSNWRGKSHRLWMEREQQPPGARLGFQEGLSQKLSDPLVQTMPQPAWMTPHLTSVMLRLIGDDTNRTDDAHDYVDDMEMVETTSTDDELESAWRRDWDGSAGEDP